MKPTSHFPCRADADLFLALKPAPRWLDQLNAGSRGYTRHHGLMIHFAINAHAGIRVTMGECVAHSLMATLRGMRAGRGDIIETLERYAAQKWSGADTDSHRKQCALARKWLARINKKVAP